MPDSNSSSRDLALLDEGAVTFTLDAWSLLELTGDDWQEWLQGQATNDVSRLTPGGRVSFCLCESTGQLLAVVDAWAVADRLLMVVPRERTVAVLERVERMTILEDVAARDLTGEYVGVSVQGTRAVAPSSEGFVLSFDRTGRGGWDVWTPSGLETDLPRLGEGAVETSRLEAGIPKWGVDMGPRTLPPELGPAFEAGHVSYAKGCYTGQEVLMRMHSRGHTNRTWVGLLASLVVSVGDEVMHEGNRVGTVSSAARSPRFGPIAAATLRNEASTEGTRVRIGEVEAEVRTMPFLRGA